MAKKRADHLLVERGLVENRTRAQALIMAGLVYYGPYGDKPLKKAGEQLPEDTAFLIKGQEHPWVSRGGIKLEHGLKYFDFTAKNITAIDVGASTGGFTDVLLHHGAQKIYAIDVGHGQIAWKLRSDERVIVMEKTNARALTSDHIPEMVDAVVCDASFISLKTVLPPALNFVKKGGWVIALIKPQFEAGRADVGPKGVVRDTNVHERVCKEITEWLTSLGEWNIMGLEKSPITGPEGNIEFLIGAQKIL